MEFSIRRLKDVAWGPSVETGATVPGDMAAWPPRGLFVFGSSVAGGVDPGRGAERFSERFFGVGDWDSYSYKGIRVRVLIVVA